MNVGQRNSIANSTSVSPKKNSLQSQNIMKSSGQQTINSSVCNVRISNPQQCTVSVSSPTTAHDALKSKSKREQEISLAVTLVLIAVVFILCQFVKLIADGYEVIYCERPTPTQDNVFAHEIGNSFCNYISSNRLCH